MGVLSTLTMDTIDAKHLIKEALLSGALTNDQLAAMVVPIIESKGYNCTVVDANCDTDETKQELLDSGVITDTKQLFVIEAKPLRGILTALNGPDHYIRELQYTRNLPGNKNPIDELTDSYNRNLD
jgi:hypothetical protein